MLRIEMSRTVPQTVGWFLGCSQINHTNVVSELSKNSRIQILPKPRFWKKLIL